MAELHRAAIRRLHYLLKTSCAPAASRPDESMSDGPITPHLFRISGHCPFYVSVTLERVESGQKFNQSVK